MLLGDSSGEGWSTVAHLQDRFAPHWLHERLVQNPDYVQRFASTVARAYNEEFAVEPGIYFSPPQDGAHAHILSSKSI